MRLGILLILGNVAEAQWPGSMNSATVGVLMILAFLLAGLQDISEMEDKK